MKSSLGSIDKTFLPGVRLICANAGAETIIGSVAITKTSMTVNPIGKIDFLMPNALLLKSKVLF